MLFLPLAAQVKFYTLVSEGPFLPGQAFQVQYVAEGATDIQQFTIPAFSDFVVLDSFESKSTSVKLTGSKVTELYSKIVVLSAKKTGRFILPAAVAIIDGKVRKSSTVKIEVVARRTAPFVMTEGSEEEIPVEEISQVRVGESIDDKIKKNLFLRASVNKKSCFEGEGVLLTYKMYSRINTSSQILKRPSLTGLSIVEMADTYDGSPDIEKLDGVPYYVNLIRKVQGFPLQPGIIPLDKAEVSSTVHFVKIEEPSDLSITGQRLTYSPYDYPVTLVTAPLSLKVNPLPTNNQPANFSGAVGTFALNIEVLKKDIHPGDLVKIRLVIKGTGNIPLLVPPQVKWPKGVDTTEPSVREELNKYVYPLEGSKSFEYTFTAPGTGVYIIPAIEFSYFNPATKSYQSRRSDSIKLQVTPGAPRNSELVQPINIDSASETIPRQLYWFAGIAFLVICWIGYQLWKGRKAAQGTVVKNEPALKDQKEIIKTDRLAPARNALAQGSIPAFYHELEKTLWIVIAEYLTILPSQLNKQNVSTILLKKGVSPEINKVLMEILNDCEWTLYAPQHEHRNAEDLLAKASAIIEKLSIV